MHALGPSRAPRGACREGPARRLARGGGVGVFVSGAAARPPRGCARSVTRTPGLCACRPPTKWRERRARTPDGGPPRPRSARSLDRRGGGGGGSPAQADRAGSAGRAVGGAWRGGAHGRGCAHVVRPVLPPGRVPRTDGRTAGDGARNRDKKGRARREGAADTYLLPGLRRLPVRGRPGAAERLVARWLAPAPHMAGRALRHVYIPRPLHVVPPSSLAIGRLGRHRLAPPGGAGPGLPLPASLGRPGFPGAWAGPRPPRPPSLLCGVEPQRPGAPRSDSEPEGGREPVGDAPSADCNRGARRWSAERGGGARSGRATLRPLGARPSVLQRALRAGQGAARAGELGGPARAGGRADGRGRGRRPPRCQSAAHACGAGRARPIY